MPETPEFEFEDTPAPAKPAPRPAANADPFAGQRVQVPGALVPPPPAQPAPTTGAARPGPTAPAPAAPADDPELKPGSRKDLWKCPHCGAGNRPERTTCRTCGKSPQEAVIRPWHRSLAARVAMAAGAAVLIAGIWFATRADLTCRAPGPAGLDDAPRQGGTGAAAEVGNGLHFSRGTGFAVSGRVLASSGLGSATAVVLALKGLAEDDAAFAATEVKLAEGRIAGATPAHVIVLYLIFPGASRPSLERGAWLSLSGSAGRLGEGYQSVFPEDAPRQVLVTTWKQ